MGLKFDEVVTKHDFKENIVYQCMYMKVSGSNFIFMVFCVDEMLLVTNDINSLSKTKQILCNHTDLKDLRETYSALGIKVDISTHQHA